MFGMVSSKREDHSLSFLLGIGTVADKLFVATMPVMLNLAHRQACLVSLADCTQCLWCGAGFKLCSLTDVEEMFAQGYNYKLTLSTALVTRSQLVMSTPTVLVRILSNLKNIYTGLQQADKVLQITDYLRLGLASCSIMAKACLNTTFLYVDSR